MILFHKTGDDVPEVPGLERIVLLQDAHTILGRSSRDFYRKERKRIETIRINPRQLAVRYRDLIALKAQQGR